MDEKEIIRQILRGDNEKYRLLLERYQPGLVNHCFTMTNDYDIAHDLTQEASIKAYLQLNRYNEDYRFSTWLYKIATNLCLDFLKKRRHISLEDIPEPLSTMLSPQEQAIKNESALQLHQAVRKLSLKYQTVISLYYWQERTYEEIANIMNVPLGTVRIWIKRAKEQLKEELHG
jgi:RNA polymerase sigma-70 factor, ECF subfamily